MQYRRTLVLYRTRARPHRSPKLSTAFEEDNEGFEIQRSTDGLAFAGIGFVKSQGSPNVFWLSEEL